MKKHACLYLVLFAACVMPVNAGERVDLLFTNRLDEEIVDVRVRYATPYDEPRHHSSHVNLPPGDGAWRVGVQGATLPEQIIFDLATKSYVFGDLSDLDPANDMRLEIAHEDGHPILRRTDGDGDAAVQGEEREYLTAANRPNAVNRDFLTSAATWEEVRELVAKTVLEAQDVEAEPIWDTAGIEETVFAEDDGWGETAYFPVFWKDWIGVARVQNMDKDDEDEGIGFDLRFHIPENGAEEMLDALLSDLCVDGFRPWRFAMRTRDGEKDEGDVVDLVFHESEGDKYDHQDAMLQHLFAAYADGSVAEASATWVKEEAFDALKAGEEPETSPGVLVMFSRGTFEALFIPNGSMLME